MTLLVSGLVAGLLALTSKRAVELYLAVTMIVFATSTFNPVLAPEDSIVWEVIRSASAVGLFIALVLDSLKGPARSPLTSTARGFCVGLTMVAGWAVLSVAWSIDPGRTLQQGFAFALMSAILVAFVVSRWRVPENLLRDTYVLYVTMGTLLLIGLVAPGNRDAISGRFTGVFDNPNFVGLVAAISVLLGLGFLMTRHHLVLTILLWAGAVGSLLVSGSRTAVVAGIAGLAWYFLRRRGGALLKALLGLAFTLAVALAAQVTLPVSVQFLLGRFMQEGSVGSLGGRTTAWSATFDIWAQRPFHGFGFRTGESLLERIAHLTYGVSHNSYLQVLVELGAVGLVLTLIPFGIVLVAAWRVRPDPVAVGYASAAVVALVTGMGESVLWGMGQAAAWYAWLVMAAAVMCVASTRSTSVVAEDDADAAGGHQSTKRVRRTTSVLR